MPVDKLEPGMEIADDVLNVNSMLLISKGTVLIPRHIRLLKTWGVERVRVVAAEDDGGAAIGFEIPTETWKAAENFVSMRFSRITVMTDSMRLIKSLAIKRAAMRMFKESQTAPIKPTPQS